jgi:4-amino-4-deoxy-L-arabinose transferase-like glycosyltransferase
MKLASSKPVVFGVVTAFLLIIFLQMVLMARANSATYDEPSHIYDGYLQWKHGYVLLNPPLITRLITLPVIGMNLPEPPIPRRPYEPLGFQAGKALVFQNDANTIMFRARMADSVFTLLLAVLVFAAAREMFGLGAGFVALGLIAFDPTLLGHSALATLDSGSAFFMFWAMYAFYRYMKFPRWWRLIGTSLTVGLALSAKHSAILLLPTFVLLAAIEVLWPKKLSPDAPAVPAARRALRLALALAVIGAVAFTMLWAAYGFHYAQADAVPFNPPMAAQLQRIPGAFSAKVLTEADKLHLLPAPYTYAFAYILAQAKSYTSYILGVTHPHAVWFYFPISMIVKSSLTFLILLAIGAWTVAAGKLRLSREVLYMAIPAAVYMVFSMTGGMNIGVRHILPVYVFLSVPMAGAAWALAEHNRRWLYAVVVLLVFQAVSVLHAFPAYISYTNEAFGGPANAYKRVSDSSADWGQQLKSVKRYLDARGVKNCWFAYFSQSVVDPASYGIPCTPLYTAEVRSQDTPPAVDGPVLISSGVLSGFETGTGPLLNPYNQFQSIKPAAIIDYGVFVYDGHFDIPLAGALSLDAKAQALLRQRDAPGALALAQQAHALAPNSAAVNQALGQILDANGQLDAANRYYATALAGALAVQPELQAARITALETRLRTGKPEPMGGRGYR